MTDKQFGGMFSSATDEWATPQAFFDELNGEFHFTLDPAANEANQKWEEEATPGFYGDGEDFEYLVEDVLLWAELPDNINTLVLEAEP